ncbi:MAG: hypothetical protein WDZ94_02070 [Patescibacteria group bacterium]
MKSLLSRHWTLILGVLLLLVLLTRLIALTALPIFADESIYIRWAQLILDEPARYAFFALNDGKTPFFIWMLLPALHFISDPLWASRFVSVVAGVFQAWLLIRITLAIGGDRKAALISGLLGLVLPFWFFHQRMAIMDAWLSVFGSLMILGSIRLSQVVNTIATAKTSSVAQLRRFFADGSNTLVVVGTGVVAAAALYTKLPAVLIFPSVFVLQFFLTKRWRALILSWTLLICSIGVGVMLFGLLALHPAFPQLFSRGGDFLYSPIEVLQGEWRVTLPTAVRRSIELTSYVPIGVFVAIFFAVFLPGKRRSVLGLFLAGVVFVLPIFILGEVVYLRYLLPSAIFFTVAAGLSFSRLLSSRPHWLWRSVAALAFVQVVISGGLFMIIQYTSPNDVPFPHSDDVQYLKEWSSGHGILEVFARVRDEASVNNTVYVATEGYFGTLPDALMVYAHADKADYYKIEGIGQPVQAIPDLVKKEHASYDQFWLVVNSHRLKFVIEDQYLIAEYCRPDNAPCLQLWNITHLVK